MLELLDKLDAESIRMLNYLNDKTDCSTKYWYNINIEDFHL